MFSCHDASRYQTRPPFGSVTAPAQLYVASPLSQMTLVAAAVKLAGLCSWGNLEHPYRLLGMLLFKGHCCVTYNSMVVSSPRLISLFFPRSSICQQPAARAELQPAGHRDQVVSPSCQRGCCWITRAGTQPANVQGCSLEGSCAGVTWWKLERT